MNFTLHLSHARSQPIIAIISLHGLILLPNDHINFETNNHDYYHIKHSVECSFYTSIKGPKYASAGMNPFHSFYKKSIIDLGFKVFMTTQTLLLNSCLPLM